MYSKKFTIGAVIAGWLIFEFLVLNGETIIDQHHQVGVPIGFTVESTGDDYRVTIGREKGGSGGVKRALTYRLVAPDGQIVHSDSEEWPLRRRSFNFTSAQTGEFVLHVNGTMQSYAGNNATWIQVDKNDNTLLLRLLGM